MISSRLWPEQSMMLILSLTRVPSPVVLEVAREEVVGHVVVGGVDEQHFSLIQTTPEEKLWDHRKEMCPALDSSSFRAPVWRMQEVP
jgi:hypothetical protein